VVLYTDGITEAENVAREQYGLERLCEAVRQHWGQSAEAVKEAVVADVRQHIGTHEVYDDITLVVVKQQ
jgi:sigma-B regulation protein RsbU (phosphoserine phosphatase)